MRGLYCSSLRVVFIQKIVVIYCFFVSYRIEMKVV